jgi:nitrogen fixation-related uncharacterized protein
MKDGQNDDLHTPAMRILFDDQKLILNKLVNQPLELDSSRQIKIGE